jgi:hypothetical protein
MWFRVMNLAVVTSNTFGCFSHSLDWHNFHRLGAYFGIVLGGLKNTVSIPKAAPNKNLACLVKKSKSTIFTLKKAKTHFWKMLKNEAFSKKLFLALKVLFFNEFPNML